MITKRPTINIIISNKDRKIINTQINNNDESIQEHFINLVIDTILSDFKKDCYIYMEN